MRKNSPALALVLLGLFLLFPGVRQLASSIFYPFQYTANAVVSAVLAVPTSISNLTKLNSENIRLKAEVKELRLKQLSFDGLEQENTRLRQVLGWQSRAPYRYGLIPAQVIGRSPSPWFSIIQINQGALAGVRQCLAVVSPDGLVGRVIEAGQLSAKIALLTDPTSSAAAACYETTDLGVVVGRSSDKLSMKYVGVSGQIKAGDRITTSNISNVFPPGILIGRVTRAEKREHDLFYQIEITPAVDFAKLTEVFVVIK